MNQYWSLEQCRWVEWSRVDRAEELPREEPPVPAQREVVDREPAAQS